MSNIHNGGRAARDDGLDSRIGKSAGNGKTDTAGATGYKCCPRSSHCELLLDFGAVSAIAHRSSRPRIGERDISQTSAPYTTELIHPREYLAGWIKCNFQYAVSPIVEKSICLGSLGQAHAMSDHL